jgi:hypothetical protein
LGRGLALVQSLFLADTGGSPVFRGALS